MGDSTRNVRKHKEQTKGQQAVKQVLELGYIDIE